MGDDPHVPLPHGAHLLHVLGELEALGRDEGPRAAAPAAALLHGPGPAHRRHQPHLDPQEDHAAAQPRGLELQRQACSRERAFQGEAQAAHKLRGVRAPSGALEEQTEKL